jgi:hypothetical protein
MKALLPLAVIVVACAHGSNASHSATELKQASLTLNRGMPGSQIQQDLGPPDETGSAPCAAAGGEQSTCTVWMYRAQQADLQSSMNLRLWLQGEPLTLTRWEWF